MDRGYRDFIIYGKNLRGSCSCMSVCVTLGRICQGKLCVCVLAHESKVATVLRSFSLYNLFEIKIK